ncbi:MAG: YicC family protein [Betaproteobacteria bacterium]|nr:YicC family protein [Betaproteobacteria bacterium]MDH5219830.1 YicC family protein [Betaproteobacteria bacterium]MDH5349282.1 YicC family protein [Betaproteobacteria bacterium]
MTGYALVSAEHPHGALTLELRSVNARFLDVQFRIADELRALEPALREAIAARVARGKVDCRLTLSGRAAGLPSLDPDALEGLRALEREARRAFPDAAPLTASEVLRWPGVLREGALAAGELQARVAALAARAVAELCATRAREGEKLAAVLGARLAEMRARLAGIAPLVPAANEVYQARLAERLREALGSADDERVRAELAVFAVKTDVAEELQRLAAHLDEAARVLATGGAAGKRLDFLAQELNREANTLASKAATREIADGALDLKLAIEQLREQAQNVE